MAEWFTGSVSENDSLFEVWAVQKIGRQEIRRSCGKFPIFETAKQYAEELYADWNASENRFKLMITQSKTEVLWEMSNV